jgi:hypothetical protein
MFATGILTDLIRDDSTMTGKPMPNSDTLTCCPANGPAETVTFTSLPIRFLTSVDRRNCAPSNGLCRGSLWK